MGCGASSGAVLVEKNRPTCSISIQTDPYQLPDVVPQKEETTRAAAAPVSTSKPQSSPQGGGKHHGKGRDMPAEQISIEDTWLAVCDTLDVPKGKENPEKQIVVKRTGWKTIRIFVSSTFRDFHYERETLVKEIFSDLRAWCEGRRLHLVECDLRWGVPKDATTEATLRTCLGEIDRCYQDNIMPYFLNMSSERIGWIPEPGELPQNLIDEYRWVFGLSVTEMEIVHGAYRRDNPNSLFMIRDDSFLANVPPQYKSHFIDENPIAASKLETLKKHIRERFPPSRVVQYKCEYDGADPKTQKVKLNLDEAFSRTVIDFFKDRISLQYPLLDKEEDPLERKRESHEAFLKSRSESVLGRGNILKKVFDYVKGAGNDTPMLILGGPGTGKSSILAKAADETCTMAIENKIPGGGKTGWLVFYHFVGAVPGSTDLCGMLQRLLKCLGAEDYTTSDMEKLVQMACSALNNPGTRPVVIFVDALNQFDDESAAELVTWVPRKLAPQIRCVFSMINDTPQHKHLTEREAKPQEVFVPPLDLTIRKDMIVEYLGKFNKRLDLDQMFSLLCKKSSENPLWLSVAAEELRVFGNFRQLSDRINSLADGLLELLLQVLSRFEEEGGGHLLIATVCLLEVSNTGLLEAELLQLLADEDNLMLPKSKAEKGSKETSEKAFKPCGNLPAFKWSGVYRTLRPFLRPFGDSGEGRLDFYHRSLSKAVRRKYLNVDGDIDTLNATYKWWHKKLADFFDHSDNYDRKVEEYPFHLIVLKDTKRLETFISEWPAFDRLYDIELSPKLLRYWREVGGYEMMLPAYSEKLQEFNGDPQVTDEDRSKRYLTVARVLIQGGIYDPALELANQALALEEKLGSKPENMMNIYSLLAHVWDQKVKLHEFCSQEQIPEEKECLKFSNKAIEILRTLKNDKFKNNLAQQLMKRAFTLASFADCGGDTEMSAADAILKGNADADEAAKIFTELKDIGKLAEATMTKAVLCRNNFSKQIKFYTDSLDKCLQAYGHYHYLSARIYMNTAICYEDARDYQKAFDHFKEVLRINREIFGEDHIKTKRSKAILQEPFYVRFAQSRGIAVDHEP